MSRHQQTERNDLRPKSIDDEFLERLGVPIVDSGADGPEYSLFAVDNEIDGTLSAEPLVGLKRWGVCFARRRRRFQPNPSWV